ncbi:MAG: sigma-70 family RNA polymerase sigma factor [Lachnospiraceae bacterium]
MNDSITRAEFEQIYSSGADKVLKVAFYYSNNNEIAEEIMQTAFLQLYEKREEIGKEYALYWAIRATKNLAINCMKRRNREVANGDIIEVSNQTDSENSAEEQVLLNQKDQEISKFKKEVFEALFEENELWHKAIILTYAMNKPQKEVAEELSMSSGALRSMLQRARNWLSKKYRVQFDNLS